ncbi:hypothetical protein MMC30_005276 [Trapelia coarctata]|nr:hypothetical protein [Trapelia coarctata]
MLLGYLLGWLGGSYTGSSIVVLLFVLLLVALVKPLFVLLQVDRLLSTIINLYLQARYPIKDQTGKHSLPTSPYTWPNGQGDTGKFLEGVENSQIWEKSNGQIYRIWSGTKGEVVLTRPEHLKEVFGDSDQHSKAANNNSGYLMSQLLGQCVGLLSGTNWRALRQVSETPFLHQNMPAYIPNIRRHVRNHFENLEKHGNLRSSLIHPAEDLKMLPFWIVAEVFYGQLPPNLIQHLRSLITLREDLFKLVIRGGLCRFSWTRFLPIQSTKNLAKFKKEWKAFNLCAYKHAKQSSSSASIVAMFEAVHRGVITQEQLYQTVDEALFANLDVTTGGISWNPVFLAADLSSQERLRKEILSTPPTDFRKYVLNSSTYLAACISESSRLKPLAAFSVPQSAPTDRLVGGYVVPAGTNFIVDAYALNVRNEYWGSDAAEYRPHRFLETHNSKTKLRYHFWRFGFGPRQCMGKYIADLIIRILLVHLVENYQLNMIDSGAEWARSSDSWITHPDMLLKCEKRENINKTQE